MYTVLQLGLDSHDNGEIYIIVQYVKFLMMMYYNVLQGQGEVVGDFEEIVTNLQIVAQDSLDSEPLVLRNKHKKKARKKPGDAHYVIQFKVQFVI